MPTLVTMGDIQTLVAWHFKLTPQDLMGPRRTRVLSYARQIAMYLCRKHTVASYEHIGDAFGGRDHTTVMSNIRKIERLITEDGYTARHIAQIRTDDERLAEVIPSDHDQVKCECPVCGKLIRRSKATQTKRTALGLLGSPCRECARKARKAEHDEFLKRNHRWLTENTMNPL